MLFAEDTPVVWTVKVRALVISDTVTFWAGVRVNNVEPEVSITNILDVDIASRVIAT